MPTFAAAAVDMPGELLVHALETSAEVGARRLQPKEVQVIAQQAATQHSPFALAYLSRNELKVALAIDVVVEQQAARRALAGHMMHRARKFDPGLSRHTSTRHAVPGFAPDSGYCPSVRVRTQGTVPPVR